MWRELHAAVGAGPQELAARGQHEGRPQSSVVESCRRLDVPLKDYLLAVLPGLNHRKHSEAAQFTPARWKVAWGAVGEGKIVMDVQA